MHKHFFLVSFLLSQKIIGCLELSIPSPVMDHTRYVMGREKTELRISKRLLWNMAPIRRS